MDTPQIPKGYLGHVVKFWPILDRASKLGISVSQEKLDELQWRLEDEKKRVFDELQEIIPRELKNLSPKRKLANGTYAYGYKKVPKKKVLELWENYKGVQDAWNGRNIRSEEYKYKPTFEEYCIKHGWTFQLSFDIEERGYKSTWFKIAPFNPSSQQLARYIEWKKKELEKSEDKLDKKLAKKYVVPRTLKTDKPTTGKKALQDLLEETGDDVIRLVIGDDELKDNASATLGQKAGIRSIAKMLTNDVRNWQPANDGCVHTQFGLTAASGQLDSRRPNILNASKHTVVGQLFRRIIEAPQGYVYVECDKKSYHVASMGYCANDKDYIRFSQLDPHSYFLAYMARGELGLPDIVKMSDKDILDICKLYKKHPIWGPIRQSAKVIVLGNQLNLGPRKAYYYNKKYFRDVADVASKQRLLAGIFPKVEGFKKKIPILADREKKLYNEFGYKQDFWDVLTWKYDREMNCWAQAHGSQFEQSIAFLVQSNAFGDMRDKLLQLEEKGLNEKYNFVNSIHDSVIFMFEKVRFDGFMNEVYPILVSPSRVLKKECCPDGLVVGVEVAMGRNWKKKSYDNEEGMEEIAI